jgi:hypothetical protein
MLALKAKLTSKALEIIAEAQTSSALCPRTRKQYAMSHVSVLQVFCLRQTFSIIASASRSVPNIASPPDALATCRNVSCCSRAAIQPTIQNGHDRVRSQLGLSMSVRRSRACATRLRSRALPGCQPDRTVMRYTSAAHAQMLLTLQ